jgi:ketosteroid isomerase-like protein
MVDFNSAMCRILTALVCAAALAGAVGCGQSDQQQARDAVEDYADARNSGDFERVCELLSDSFKQTAAIGQNCPAFVQEQTSGASGEFKVVQVSVNDDNATATLDVEQGSDGPSRVQLRLVRQGDDWRITSF